ncbi:acyl-CoA dehydrogenase family protein [Streptacidiphilus pinicola]|uniref:acyl-CoA dehydrogenase family protein n=1 Tax=Streptacidiphilus pinicola TaxID=2219663 RepID=UPI001FB3BAE4|nr:acyl-CoA dehydrogenase family protein [Streptacidiphilus pinicola]
MLDSGLLDVLREASVRTARSGRPDEEALRAVRGSGLLGLVVPVEYGGAGRGASEVNAVVGEVARVDPSTAIILFQHYAVSARISEWGTPAQQARLLPEMAAGRVLAASAWSETGAGAAKKRLASTGRADADGFWTLDGAKSFTTGAGIADLYLVLVQTSEAEPETKLDDSRYGSQGQTFFLVGADNPGLTPDLSLDLAGMRGSATGFVSLSGCRVADEDRLGPLGRATEIIAGVRETGATLGAVSAGIARALLELARAHAARAGVSADSPLSARLVDLATSVEAIQAVVTRAGRREAPEPGIATLHSKLFASQAAEQIALEVSRLMGSAGYVMNHRLNTLLADARAVALMGPANQLCRELIAVSWQR